jgi:DNA sulfur modification protein DndC
MYGYLKPLKGLKAIYRWLRLPGNRLRKNGETNKGGELSKNPNRLGPITLEVRLKALEKILAIQSQCNEAAIKLGMPLVDIINPMEEARIRELIANKTFPEKWTGDEITGDVPIETIYSDGSIQKILFNE